MATDEAPQNPFTKPSFIIAAILIAFILIFGIAVVFLNVAKKDVSVVTSETGESSTNGSTSNEAPATGSNVSICGLKGVVLEGTLSIAPETQWEYQDTTAYPISAQYGPGKVSEEGYRYCFQHSPEGALLAAANAAVQATSFDGMESWLNYFLAEGPYRESVLNQDAPTTSSEDTRIDIAGFRLLSYDGGTAKVDIGVRGSTEGQTVTLSMVYTLVWEDGDWKLEVNDPSSPLNVANIPDLSGYTTWGE